MCLRRFAEIILVQLCGVALISENQPVESTASQCFLFCAPPCGDVSLPSHILWLTNQWDRDTLTVLIRIIQFGEVKIMSLVFLLGLGGLGLVVVLLAAALLHRR